jgi:hypothetical protein
MNEDNLKVLLELKEAFGGKFPNYDELSEEDKKIYMEISLKLNEE